jgi:hypothetical protein
VIAKWVEETTWGDIRDALAAADRIRKQTPPRRGQAADFEELAAEFESPPDF